MDLTCYEELFLVTRFETCQVEQALTWEPPLFRLSVPLSGSVMHVMGNILGVVLKKLPVAVRTVQKPFFTSKIALSDMISYSF